MAGVLFLFIAIIVVFALNMRVKQDEARQEKESLRRQAIGPLEARMQLLGTLEDALRTAGVKVVVDAEHGILRLPDDSVSFPQGTDLLVAASRRNLSKLALILGEVLPCYSANAEHARCSGKRAPALLDAVLIEGHTDRHRVIRLARFRDNWELSAARAIRTYDYLLSVESALDGFANQRGERLLSVSGYADSRPVDASTTPEADSRNRRIDLRFIMAPPAPDLEPKVEVERGIRTP